MTEKQNQLRCSKCRAESLGATPEECLKNFKCGLTGAAIDDSCKPCLQLDGKPVFELKQVIKIDSEKPTEKESDSKKPSKIDSLKDKISKDKKN